LTSLSEIDAVGHRVLHGGAEFTESVIVDDRVIDAIRKCIPLGPLHNPANLTGILACSEVMEGIPQVAVFDTAFHQTMPEKAYLYALPYEYYEKHGVRRYGFHGTSHRYVSQKAAEIVGKPAEDLKIIVCHLGNGSSISAVNGGKCIDTSMGLTPLEGVPMGTRSGCIDPAILEFIMNAESIDISEMTDILNKKSGVLGISGISSDFRDLDEAKVNGHKRAIIALECFAYSVKKYIGAYVAALGGLDILVFTAGIGENNYKARKEITSGLEFMGISIDDEKNINNQTDISAEGSRVRTLVVPTNEELAIAIDTMALVEKLVK
jgi:acetate kinase